MKQNRSSVCGVSLLGNPTNRGPYCFLPDIVSMQTFLHSPPADSPVLQLQGSSQPVHRSP